MYNPYNIFKIIILNQEEYSLRFLLCIIILFNLIIFFFNISSRILTNLYLLLMNISFWIMFLLYFYNLDKVFLVNMFAFLIIIASIGVLYDCYFSFSQYKLYLQNFIIVCFFFAFIYLFDISLFVNLGLRCSNGFFKEVVELCLQTYSTDFIIVVPLNKVLLVISIFVNFINKVLLIISILTINIYYYLDLFLNLVDSYSYILNVSQNKIIDDLNVFSYFDFLINIIYEYSFRLIYFLQKSLDILGVFSVMDIIYEYSFRLIYFLQKSLDILGVFSVMDVFFKIIYELCEKFNYLVKVIIEIFFK